MSKNFDDLKAQGVVLVDLVKQAIAKIEAGGSVPNAEVDAMTASLKASSEALDAAIKAADGATGPTGPTGPSDGSTGPTGPTGPTGADGQPLAFSAAGRAEARRLAGGR